MAKRAFKENPVEEAVSPQGVVQHAGAAASVSFELPAAPVVPVETALPDSLPTPMLRPIVREDLPTLVAPQIEPIKIRKADEQIMNAGAVKLLEYLPDDAKELVLEYAAAHEVPLWQVIGGYIMRCRDNGEMFAPNILPDWENMIAPNAVRACGTCGASLQPMLLGQTFCCNSCASGALNRLGHNENCALLGIVK